MKDSKRVCYFCGKIATTREHAPPKQMFKDFDCDSITVPSCKKHNCNKSGEDQAIVSALLTSIKNCVEYSKEYKSIFGKDINKAIEIASPTFNRTKNRVFSRPFLENMPNEIKHLPEVGFLKSPIKISEWIKNLTAAIVFDATQHYETTIDWENIECWSPDYFDSKLISSPDDKINLLIKYAEYREWLSTKKWIKGWSAYPKKYPENIYCFFFCFEFNDFTIKHRFYNSYSWYASFKPALNTKEIILKKLNIKSVM